MKLLTATEVARLVGVRYRTLDSWVRQGIVRPTIAATGRGNHRMFRFVPDVLGVALARHLRHLGLSMETAGNVYLALAGIPSESALLAEFEAGRTCIGIVGRDVLPGLWRKAALVGAIDENRDDPIFVAAREAGLSPLVLDVRVAYLGILKACERLADEGEPVGVGTDEGPTA